MIDTSTLDIRPAEPADVPALTRLTHELGYPSSTEDEVTGRLTTWTGRDDLLVLVAASGEQVVGVAALAVIPYFERPGSWGRVVALVVDARTRGLGVGRTLLAATEQAALARGCTNMEISSARRRVDAHAFYRSVGYVDRCDYSAKFFKELTT
ncbi:GNAT family N-acetyltransferase [Pseudonocardia sp. TRM90224]|uniref:GNAT family N-acetyltransferase n=1 Tax=Pseudonocardia sp. TRM90224 TaxID=2812678 RepID=UPI001E347071|nr:GNAT family N-acetyltransferase [Pseudonocardia sp. TRM90224]